MKTSLQLSGVIKQCDLYKIIVISPCGNTRTHAHAGEQVRNIITGKKKPIQVFFFFLLFTETLQASVPVTGAEMFWARYLQPLSASDVSRWGRVLERKHIRGRIARSSHVPVGFFLSVSTAICDFRYDSQKMNSGKEFWSFLGFFL